MSRTKVVFTGMCWVLKESLSAEQLSKIKYAYTHINPMTPDTPFSTFLELHGKIGLPLGDKGKIKSILGELEIEDKRISPEFSTKKTSKLALRDYQEESMKEILQYISKGGTEFNLSGYPRNG